MMRIENFISDDQHEKIRAMLHKPDKYSVYNSEEQRRQARQKNLIILVRGLCENITDEISQLDRRILSLKIQIFGSHRRITDKDYYGIRRAAQNNDSLAWLFYSLTASESEIRHYRTAWRTASAVRVSLKAEQRTANRAAIPEQHTVIRNVPIVADGVTEKTLIEIDTFTDVQGFHTRKISFIDAADVDRLKAELHSDIDDMIKTATDKRQLSLRAGLTTATVLLNSRKITKRHSVFKTWTVYKTLRTFRNTAFHVGELRQLMALIGFKISVPQLRNMMRKIYIKPQIADAAIINADVEFKTIADLIDAVQDTQEGDGYNHLQTVIVSAAYHNLKTNSVVKRHFSRGIRHSHLKPTQAFNAVPMLPQAQRIRREIRHRRAVVGVVSGRA